MNSKVNFILIFISLLSINTSFSQNIDYNFGLIKITHTQDEFCQDLFDEEEFVAFIEMDDDNIGSNPLSCLTCVGEETCTNTGPFTPLSFINVPVTEVNLQLSAWEDDAGALCSSDPSDQCAFSLVESTSFSFPLEYQSDLVSEGFGNANHFFSFDGSYIYHQVAIPEAVENTTDIFTTGGDRPFWGSEGAWSQGGTNVDCATSGTIGHDETSTLTAEISGKDEVAFWWKVSCEADNDYLGFRVNGVTQARIDGEVGWTQVTIPLTGGTDIVEWVYFKDEAISEGLDRGFVDLISFNQTGCQSVFYVDLNASGNNDGESWGNAFTDLHDAIDAAVENNAAGCPTTQIWVAEGTYIPTRGSNGNVSTSVTTGYYIPEDMEIYGGFDGSEAVLSDRDIDVHPTIITGDLGTITANYPFTFLGNNITNACILDGFTVQEGGLGGVRVNAFSAGRSISPIISNCTLKDNVGTNGNAFSILIFNASAESHPKIINCEIFDNTRGVTVSYNNGGDYSLSIENTKIYDNSNNAINVNGAGGGSGFMNALNSLIHDNNVAIDNTVDGTTNSTINLTNSTIVDNQTAIENQGVSGGVEPNIFTFNSIIWNNSSSIENTNALTTIEYTLLQDGTPGVGGLTLPADVDDAGGNIDLEPIFEDPITGDYSLSICSPAIDAGDDFLNSSTLPDLAGNTRKFNTIDLGAYEFQGTSVDFLLETIIETACDSFVTPEQGNSLYATGLINDTIFIAGACDSIITYNVSINQSTTSSISPIVCGQYTSPSGEVYTTSQIFNDTIPNSSGCDSVILIDLTVNSFFLDTILTIATDSFVTPEQENVIYVSGTVNDTIYGVLPCDSIITYLVTIDDSCPTNWVQIGSDIEGEADYDRSSYSVSLNASGSIVAIGARDNTNTNPASGHVRVYQNNAGAWTQIGGDINGEAAGDQSGTSVSLSADGNIVAIGATGSDATGSNAGHVRIYQNNAGTWMQIGDDIDGEAAGDGSGRSVSISSNGNIVAIGAIGNDATGSNAGHVRVYQNNAGTWTQIGNDIDGEAAADFSGQSISLSADGSIVAIGAPRNNGNGSDAGHVRVYQNNAGTWTQIGGDINGEAAEDGSGGFVSLSADGSIVAIGARENDGGGSDAGHVRVYQNNAGTWVQIGNDIDGENAGDFSGASVSLNEDGSIVVIGSVYNSGNNGYARVFKNIGGTWTLVGNDIEGAAAEYLGFDVSLNDDGSIVATGSIGDDGNGFPEVPGFTRVYELVGCCEETTAVIDTLTCGTYIAPSGASYTTSSIFNDTISNVLGCDSVITIDLTVLETEYTIATAATSLLNNSCELGEWTHYYDENDKIVFSIKKNGNEIDCDVTMSNNVTYYAEEDALNNEAVYVSQLLWDVEATGSDITEGVLSTPVSIRYYFEESYLTDIEDAANTFAAVNGISVFPLAWFKSDEGDDFDPSTDITAQGLLDAYDLDDVAYGETFDGVDFVQINNVIGFSGGGAYVQVLDGTVLDDSGFGDLQINTLEGVQLSPNPFIDQTTLQNNTTLSMFIEVYSSTGVLVDSFTSSSDLNFGNEYIAGVYFLKIEDQSGVISIQRIVKL